MQSLLEKGYEIVEFEHRFTQVERMRHRGFPVMVAKVVPS